MSSQIRLSFTDRLIVGFDRAVRTLSPGSTRAERASPAAKFIDDGDACQALDKSQRRHVGGLIRINHTGEVCAQALYQGQALTARAEQTRKAMQVSADEEFDHLAWCEERLNELGESTSVLNPVFYGLSFGIGVTAGLIGDQWSLGFIAATEEQVCKHLRGHLERLPETDDKSKAILQQMLVDEEAHGMKALDHGGTVFSPEQKKLMTVLSKIMTSTTYQI